jgi:hypothetical protein
MAKLAQTQEPSMEEILASIRRIITEDETGERPAVDRGTRAPQRAEAQPKPAKRAVEEPEDDPEDVAESADVLELSEAQVTAVHESSESALSADADYPDPVHGLNGSPARGIVARDEPAGAGLLSANADATVTSAFSTLANTILSNEARTLEDIVREMLRPMLKAWLDDNLPPLVERLVRDEIERVSRGRR